MVHAIGRANLGRRFVLEAVALGISGWWGANAGGSWPDGIVLVAGLPLLAGVAWGAFVAPNAVVATPAVAFMPALPTARDASGTPAARRRPAAR